VTVWVNLGQKAPLQGQMFLRPSIVTLSGVESIADRLNDRDAFFPLRLEESEQAVTVMIGKAQVRYVAADEQPPPDEIVAASQHDATQFKLSLELDDGEELFGLFHAVLPRGKRRLLDYINAPLAGPYVPFYVGRRVYVINRSFIRRLRERTD
jgi:hypothetical protein